MAYQLINAPSSKQVFEKYNKDQLNQFKRNNDESLEIYPVSLMPGRIVQAQAVTYHKKKYLVDENGQNYVRIYEKSTVDGSSENVGFTWHSTAENIKMATRYGIVSTQSVTGKVMAALGRYRAATLERIEDGYISNRYLEKEKLVEHYQDRVEALMKLESFANQPISDPLTMLNELKCLMADYVAVLENKKNNLVLEFAQTKLSSIDKNGIIEIELELSAAIDRANRFSCEELIASGNRSTGIDSVLTWVKTQMIHDLREMQNHNQNMTYSRHQFAGTRGELNSAIEDAQKDIETYQAPIRDSVNADHHGQFSDTERVIYDSAYHCSSSEEARRALLAISFIEKMNAIDVEDGSRASILARDIVRPSTLDVVSATSWRVTGGVLGGLRRIALWLVNVSIKIVAGAIELPLTLIIEPLLFGFGHAFFKFVRSIAVAEFRVVNSEVELSATTKELLAASSHPVQSLGLRVRHITYMIFKNTIIDLMYGVRDLYREFSIHLFDEVINDYKSGELANDTLESVLKKANEEIEAIEKLKIEKINRVFAGLNREPITTAQPSSEEKFAQPTYLPDSGDWEEVVSAVAGANEAVFSFILHNCHAKHPLTGMIFNVAYIAGGLAVFAPNLVSFLGGTYQVVSQTIGYGMSKSALTAGISSGSLQAQIAACGVNVAMYGPKSWLATGAQQYEYDPFTSSIYAATAVGIGYLMVFQVNVPFISEVLKEDVGNFKPASLAVIGGKSSVLAFEVVKEEWQSLGLRQEKHEHLIIPQDNLRMLINEFMRQHDDNLIHLSSETKHRLYLQCTKDNLFTRSEAEAFKKRFSPEDHPSILRATLRIIVGYPIYLLRIVAAVISSVWQGNFRPLQAPILGLGLKVIKDITRVARAVNKIVKTLYGFVRRQAKTLGDVLVNSGLARAEALLADQHMIANSAYKISANLDSAHEKLRQFLSTPVDATNKLVTNASAEDIQEKMLASYMRMFKPSPAESSVIKNTANVEKKTMRRHSIR